MKKYDNKVCFRLALFTLAKSQQVIDECMIRNDKHPEDDQRQTHHTKLHSPLNNNDKYNKNQDS